MFIYAYTELYIFQLSGQTFTTEIGIMLGVSKEDDLVEIWLCQICISASHSGDTHCSCSRAWPYVILWLCVSETSRRRNCSPAGTCRVKRCDKSLLLLQQAEKSHFSHCIKGKKNVPFSSRGWGCKDTDRFDCTNPQVSPSVPGAK